MSTCQNPEFITDQQRMGPSDEEEESPLDFSAAKKVKLEKTSSGISDKEIFQEEDATSRLRHILSMKAHSMAPEDLAGTILNLSKKSFTTASWLNNNNNNEKFNSTCSSTSNSPVSDHPSAFTAMETSSDRSVPAVGNVESRKSPFVEGAQASLPNNFHSLGFTPFALPSFSPDFNPLGLVSNGNGAPVAMPFPTSPNSGNIFVDKVGPGVTSPKNSGDNIGKNLSPAVNCSKTRTTRPFKAYPKDPLTFPTVGMYGLPLGCAPGSTEALIQQQSNNAYTEFRKQMLTQTQSVRGRSKGGLRTSISPSRSVEGLKESAAFPYGLKLESRTSSGDESLSGTESNGCPKGNLDKSGKSDRQTKDEAYWERRRKNNEAAKRSRDARRAKEDEIAIRAAFLEQENLKLRFELCTLKNEAAKLRCMLYSS